MKLTVCLMLIALLGCDVLMAKSPTRPEILKTYTDLMSFRNNSDAVLLGGQGVMVIKSSAGSTLEALDIVVAFNHQPIESVAQLLELAEKTDPVKPVELTILRAGKTQILTDKKSAYAAMVSDMLPTQVDELISSKYVSDKELSVNEDALMMEYLKGRPYRTPNNRDAVASDKDELKH